MSDELGRTEGNRYRLWRDPWIGGIDERLYAAFRIAFSFVALVNLVNLWFYRDALFTAGGMIPTDVVAEVGWHTHLSVFRFVESGWGVNVCFVIAAGAIVCLGLGVFPRISSVVVFVWHLSFTNRILPACTGWDHVLRAYSFLVMVSPLGRCWSFRNISPSTLVPAYGISLMRVQLFVIYWQGVRIKLTDKFWQDGEFLPYFLMSLHGRWPDERIAAWSPLLVPMTYFAVIIELAIPVLLLVRRTRNIGFFLGIGFHLLIAIIGRHLFLFSLTMWMTYVGFIDVGVLDRVEALVRSRRRVRKLA
jgi:hypothetical protein